MFLESFFRFGRGVLSKETASAPAPGTNRPPSNQLSLDHAGNQAATATPSAVDLHVRAFQDLCRLARFGANLADAHSCFIFLPFETVEALSGRSAHSPSADDLSSLVLSGFHSLSEHVVQDCKISKNSGLIGWVARHQRSIHVSPFELDSRTLGIYSEDQKLKSLIGIPVPLSGISGEGAVASTQGSQETNLTGVIACDSKKSFAFSKLQGKLLEDLSREISNTVELLLSHAQYSNQEFAWDSFWNRSEELRRALGNQSIEVIRIRPRNLKELERALGLTTCMSLVDQITRLVQQALPAHFPIVRLFNGEILITLDNMLVSFYENKIRALCAHVGAHPHQLQVDFVRSGTAEKKRKFSSLEEFIHSTSRAIAKETESESSSVVRLDKELGYGYRRA